MNGRPTPIPRNYRGAGGTATAQTVALFYVRGRKATCNSLKTCVQRLISLRFQLGGERFLTVCAVAAPPVPRIFSGVGGRHGGA